MPTVRKCKPPRPTLNTCLADQFGYVCIGILVDVLATLVSGAIMVAIGWRLKLKYNTDLWPGLAISVIVVGIWELSAYRSSVKQATGTFPVDANLLSDNAIIATIYMALGAILGFAFHLTAYPALAISLAVVIAAILLAPRWLWQKIIWQEASIPYLFRLADAAPTINDAGAKTLQGLIDAGAPPDKPPSQIVIDGPIGSGRTSIAAGIGTEFAFKQNKVR